MRRTKVVRHFVHHVVSRQKEAHQDSVIKAQEKARP